MKIRALLFAATILAHGLWTVTGAFAEDQPPAPAKTEEAQPAPLVAKLFYLEVDQNDIAAISTALNELPKRVADPLILKLNAQLNAQQPVIETKAKAAVDDIAKKRVRK